MGSIQATRERVGQNAASIAGKRKWLFGLALLFYPVGIFKIWRSRTSVWIKLAYSILGLPVFLLTAFYLTVVIFAAFLPALDRSIGHRADRKIVNSAGNYSVTFINSGWETNGAYELVEVELEPLGGNDWHYHTRFEESFKVLEGAVHIGQDGKAILLNEGDSATANKKDLHYFKNARKEKSVLLVKVAPAGGLEKTLRVGYGLMNDGLLHDDMTENPWHMVLLLAYSESYLPWFPSWFQEQLIEGLAKIAQWKGEDKTLYKYFK